MAHVFSSFIPKNSSTLAQDHHGSLETIDEMKGNVLNGDLEYPNHLSTELEQQCGICLDPFQVDDLVSWSKYLYSCRHVYHQRCIESWLNDNRHDDCPCCRGTFIRESPDVQGMRINCCRLRCCFKDKNGAHGNDDDDVIMMQQRELGQFCLMHGLILTSETCNEV